MSEISLTHKQIQEWAREINREVISCESYGESKIFKSEYWAEDSNTGLTAEIKVECIVDIGKEPWEGWCLRDTKVDVNWVQDDTGADLFDIACELESQLN